MHLKYGPIKRSCTKALKACATRVNQMNQLGFETLGASEVLSSFNKATHEIAKKFQRVVHSINELYQRDEVGINVLLPLIESERHEFLDHPTYTCGKCGSCLHKTTFIYHAKCAHAGCPGEFKAHFLCCVASLPISCQTCNNRYATKWSYI